MTKTLASFLDRRKKSTVKAAALLLQTAEAKQQAAKAKAGAEEPQPEQPSDHDDEWKVSDDEDSAAFKNQAALSGSLMKSVRTVAGDCSEERGGASDPKPTQQVWQSLTEPVEKDKENEDDEPKEDVSKVWVPKFRSGGKGGLSTRNDVDLAEAARVVAAKVEAQSVKKTKKVKKKPESTKPADDDDPTCYVKVKFNVFSVVPEQYHTFKSLHPGSSLDAEKVKAKYLGRPAFAEAA